MKLVTLLIVYEIVFIDRAETASPKLQLCLDTNQIGWRDSSPYVEQKSNANHSGILLDIFQDGMRACCRGNLESNFTIKFNNADDLMDLMASQSVDFILPVQQGFKKNSFLQFPFVSLIESPGVAFYVVPESDGSKILFNTISSVAPLLSLMLLMVVISGVLFYMCESLTLAWTGIEPKAFGIGISEGIWWSFVTMTTVGYGDVIPKTKIGKLFNLLWVVIGLILCTLFTSSMTTMFTVTLMNRDVTLSNAKVAVLKGSQEYGYAIKNRAIPVTYQSVSDIIEALFDKKVTSALIDVYVAGEYQEKLKMFELQNIFEHMSMNGVIFKNNGFYYAPCVRDYVWSRKSEIFELIAKRVKPLKVHPNTALKKSNAITSIDTSSFYMPLSSLFGVLIFFILLGVIRDVRTRRHAKMEENIKNKSKLDDLTLCEWKRDYRIDLDIVAMAVRNDLSKIKIKSDAILDKLEDLQNSPVLNRSVICLK